jgi:arabinoxylan arabinofuranohydrolase
VRGVDFGNGQASSFTASVASGSQGGSIEMHQDSVDGPEIGSLQFHPRGDARMADEYDDRLRRQR